MERQIGIVSFVVKDKGYWFILSNGERIFAHISHYSQMNPPSVGDTVSFEVGEGRYPNSKKQAVKIRLENTPATVGAKALEAATVERAVVGDLEVTTTTTVNADALKAGV